MYYVTTGEWVGDKNQQAVVNTAKKNIDATNLCDDVVIRPVDSGALRQIYRELKNQIETQVRFEKRSTLPEIDGVHEAYIGALRCAEFLKLIVDDDGELRKRLFYDNVRDFQGRNPVNSEIAETLSAANMQDRFVLLNNGITIVAKDLRTTGDNFTIIDYQIVNGCQTSHILYALRDSIEGNTYLPIKLVVTADAEITNAVTKASNRQTEVKIEAFEALEEFHKDLEAFYTSFQSGSNTKIYYERRSKQYEGQPIKPTQIVSVAGQLKSFLAMFLDEPHSNHRYYGELLKSNEHKVFLPDHQFDAYYASALCMSTFERALRRKVVPFYYRRFKFHFFLLYRVIVAGYSMPRLDAKKSSTYCAKIIEALCDTKRTDTLFREIRRVIDTVRKQNANITDNEILRRRSFTEALLSKCEKNGERRSNEKSGVRIQADKMASGVVKWYKPSRGFGFITVGGSEDVFFHINECETPWWRLTQDNVNVDFVTRKTKKGMTATKVRLADSSVEK